MFPKKDQDSVDGVIDVSYANFGLIPYGHSMHGKIFFDTKFEKACEEMPHDYFYKEKKIERDKDEGAMSDREIDDKVERGDMP